MKTIKLAVLISAVLHVLYFIGILTTGFIRTTRYEPDIVSRANNVQTLQSAVAIGATGSPFFFVITFIGVAFLSGCVLMLLRKQSKPKGSLR